jgi:hypothetical protein
MKQNTLEILIKHQLWRTDKSDECEVPATCPRELTVALEDAITTLCLIKDICEMNDNQLARIFDAKTEEQKAMIRKVVRHVADDR